VFEFRGIVRRDFLTRVLPSKALPYTYVFTPKCACTTLKNVLWAAEARAGLCPPVGDKNYVHGESQTARSPWLAQQDIPEDVLGWEHRLIFTFIRNPFARAISAYRSMLANGDHAHMLENLEWTEDAAPSLIDFLRSVERRPKAEMDHHWAPLTEILPNVKFDYIGSVETLETDARALLNRIFGSDKSYDPSLKMYHTGGGEEPIDPESWTLIRRIYAADFEAFGYTVPGSKPDSRKLAAFMSANV
jgi:hypothetical protein